MVERQGGDAFILIMNSAKFIYIEFTNDPYILVKNGHKGVSV